MRLFKNYKWTLAAIPNGMILTYLIPSRYPLTIRGSVGYCVVMLGWWGHKRAAHNRTVANFKKRMIMDHFDQSEVDQESKEKARRRLFGDEFVDAQQQEQQRYDQ